MTEERANNKDVKNFTVQKLKTCSYLEKLSDLKRCYFFLTVNFFVHFINCCPILNQYFYTHIFILRIVENTIM